MTNSDSKEARRLAALNRLFAEPEIVARRFKKKAIMFFVCAIGIALVSGFVGKHESGKDLSIALILLSGILIGLGASYRASAREVAILARYCMLKKE